MRVHKPVLPKSVGLRHGDEALASGFLGFDRDRVLEVSQHHVHLPGELGHLGAHLLDVRRDEMDHPLKP